MDEPQEEFISDEPPSKLTHDGQWPDLADGKEVRKTKPGEGNG